MARSHHRKKHHHPQQHHQVATAKTKRKATPIFIILFAIFGGAIGYFASPSVTALVIGFMAGAVTGYLIGRNLDDNASKK